LKLTETSIFLGDVHREQAWKRWINSACSDVHDHQQDLLEALNQIAASITPAAYEESVKLLQSSDVWIGSQLLQDWFSQEWISQYEVSDPSNLSLLYAHYCLTFIHFTI